MNNCEGKLIFHPVILMRILKKRLTTLC